ncbi:MAG: radical SAM protein [Candidatus Altiarchaeota archaeon]
MSMRVVDTPYHSRRIGSLPGGCRLCVKGAKLVLLVTGVCSSRCWYCPLSERKKNKDVVVANEWWVKRDKDILDEARLCDAEGAGITGGDPLCRLDRTLHYIRLLKRKFGRKFHIHLYTDGRHATPKAIARLHSVGLDEIRFHPQFVKAGADLRAVEEALKYDWDVGCEIPVVPNYFNETVKFIKEIDKLGVHFLNLNQMEVSETNAKALLGRGYEAESDVSFAVKGSSETADRLLKYCSKNTRLRVHYCTVKLKDGVQLRNRMKRRARNVAKEYDILTTEGLLIRGAIYLPETVPSFGYKEKVEGMKPARKATLTRKISSAMRKIKSTYSLDSKLIELDESRLRILTGAWIVEELAEGLKGIGLRPAVVEEYPTWDRLITDLRIL